MHCLILCVQAVWFLVLTRLPYSGDLPVRFLPKTISTERKALVSSTPVRKHVTVKTDVKLLAVNKYFMHTLSLVTDNNSS